MMRFNPIIPFVFFLSCIAVPVSMEAQKKEWPIKTWVKLLSIPDDIHENQQRRVHRELKEIDTADICEVINQLQAAGSPASDKFQIRMSMQRIYLGKFRTTCNWLDFKDEMEAALQRAYKINDDLLIAYLSQQYSQRTNYKHDIATATLYAINAADIQDKLGPEKFQNVAYSRYLLGHLMYHTREYDKCISYTHQAMEWHLDTVIIPGDPRKAFYVMNAWNTIALANEKLGRFEKANIALDSAGRWADIFGVPFWKGLIAGNRGDILLSQGKYEEAENLLAFDYTTSKNAGQLDNAGNSLQWLAYINILKGHLGKAGSQLNEADSMLRIMPNRTYRMNFLSTKTELYKATKQMDSAFHYSFRFNVLKDSIDLEVAQSNSDIARLKSINQANISAIQNLERNKERAVTLRNFTIIIVIMIGVAGWLYLNRLRLKMKFNQQQAKLKIQKAESETLLAKSKLDAFMANMMEKTTLIKKLKEDLHEKENIREHQQIIHTLSNQTILTDDDWDRFKTLFDEVYTGFFYRLREYTNDISQAEQRMAALIRLQLSTKEAASLLAVSPDTIHKTRQRLKHRLKLHTVADLDDFIQQL